MVSYGFNVEMDGEVQQENSKEQNEEKTEGKKKLEKWLNKSMKIKMTDGRTLIGVFLCTDKDRNVILGSCEEYLRSSDAEDKEDPRILGLAMIPGHQIVTVHIDENNDIDHRIL